MGMGLLSTKAGVLLFGTAVVLCLNGLAAAQAPFVKQDDYAGIVVLINEKASDTEKAAAAEFVDYWKRISGRGALMTKKPLKNIGLNVWIGREGVPDELLNQVKLDGLGPDGFCIQTLRLKKRGPGHLLIVGGKENGTLYGVYQFLEDYLGVRFLTPDVTYVPKAPPAYIPEIDVRHVPQIQRRQLTYDIYGMQGVPDDKRAAYARHMRWCASPQFGLFVHTAFTLVPPDKYFAEHPDFYSEINGKRVAPLGIDLTVPANMAQHGDLRTQLCMSNPKVAETIVAELKPRMQAAPDTQVWSVSQMDWDAYCTCDACREINDREGTPMGAWLTGINRVADMIRGEFPNNYIETLAYQWSRKPPRTLVPRDNVIVSLCSIECDYSRPITDTTSAVNKAFADDLMGWSRIAKNLFMWDYPANCYFSQIPYPNFNVLNTNYAFYAQHNVKGMFLCGGSGFADDLGALRCYLLSHLLWKPDTDIRPLMNDFIEIYYQDTAPYIRSYIDLMTRTVRAKGAVMHCLEKGTWIDANTVIQAEEIFKQAFATAKNDAVKQRLEDLYSSVRYCAIVCPPKIDIADGKFTLTRPPCMTVEEYIKHLESRGFKTFNSQSVSDYVIERTGKVAPPRSEESTIEVIENADHLVWIVPALKGSVIRWRDKRLGVELLRGYECYGGEPGTWQDWTNTPGRPESPVADVYEVADRKPESLTLRAKREDGLVIERSMTLGADGIEVALTLSNPTDKPLSADVKIHPEFFAQGEMPEIFTYKDRRWLRQNERTNARAEAEGKYISLDGESQLAFHLPARKLSVVCTFDPKEIAGLLWFYNTASDAQQCNLELLPKSDPLGPGEKRTLPGIYSVIRGKPAGM